MNPNNKHFCETLSSFFSINKSLLNIPNISEVIVNKIKNY